MDLHDRFPGKVRFSQYNTGGIGEILESIDTPAGKRKKQMRKPVRVPIPLMAAIQRGDLRGVNKYELGSLGTMEIKEVEGFNLKEYDPHRFYDHDTVDAFIADLIKGRREFTESLVNEGLDKEIIKWAEKSFEISRSGTERMWAVNVPAEDSIKTSLKVAGDSHDNGNSTLFRPPRSLGWRTR